MESYDVIIIGAGPAGLFAALSIDTTNKKVLVLEKNKKPGKKLLLAGAGQCNITHSGNVREFFNHYGDNGRFLKNAFNNLNNKDLIDFFEKNGLDIITYDSGKVFPKSLNSEDVLEVLINNCIKNKVKIEYNTPVLETISESDYNFKVKTFKRVYKAKNLVIATGGKSYPQTGSSGDGYKFIKMLNHKLKKPLEALTSLDIKDFNLKDLSGISFEKCIFSIWRNNKKIDSFNGDILITHKGLSGPGILNNSRYMYPGDIIKINFVNAENIDEFRNHFLKDLNKSGKDMIKTLLKRYNLAKRFVSKILEILDIKEEKLCSQLTKNERKSLLKTLTEFPFEIGNLSGFHIAMVTRGGVSLKEVSSKSMESKKIKGLFFIGEVLDIDGDTGGYNIQAAFSTGALAAKSINKV
ncbi:MAG: NAD(P)/FAD-dependent oxidoreductase [Firmicutes bacterium]|nr:NAD(P)/FAD-dependent oxidoreductase [Bacillota bacterium]